MTDRDMARARLLRTTLAALENAEAVVGTDSSDGILGYGDVPAERSLTMRWRRSSPERSRSWDPRGWNTGGSAILTAPRPWSVESRSSAAM